jgi:Tol biopolymer transport system component
MRTRQIQITRLTVTLFTLATCLFVLASRAEASPPANGKIAFQSDRTGNQEIFSMNPDGTDQIRLTNNSANDGHPSWSPDGKKIAFNSTRVGGDEEIFVMNADGSNQIRLTFASAPDNEPSWSPDGTKIAFQSSRDGNREIYVMNADGTNQTRLTLNSAVDARPSWSSNGTKIVFESERDGNSEIYVMNADGTNQTRLTNDPATDGFPAFSPDGAKIVFTRQGSGVEQIFVMNANGANPVQLTSSAVASGDPAFSPDGSKIAFDTFRDSGNLEIYVMNPDGTSQTRVTTSTGEDFAPSWQPIRPPDTIGLYRPSTGEFLERNTNTSGRANAIVDFGQAGDLPIAGDWNGDGISDVGVFRNGQFLLRQPAVVTILGGQTFTIVTTITVNFGVAGDLPVVGDWNGDGKDTPGVFRPGSPGTFFLTNSNTNNTAPPADIVFNFGATGDRPVAGDWDGDGLDTIGVASPPNVFALRNSNSGGPADVTFFFGNPGDLPFFGDWNGDGIDTVGLLRSGTIFLRDSNTTGVADVAISFGQSGDLPIAGVWNKPPNSGVNDPSEGSSQAGQIQQFTTTCSDIDGWRNIATIDFKIARSNGNGNGVPIALWVQFDESNNLIHFYDPDSQSWSDATPGSFMVLSSRFAELHLAQTSVLGSGPNGRSVKITWSVVFKDAAIMNNYKQFLLITDDAGFNTGFDNVGSWSVRR